MKRNWKGMGKVFAFTFKQKWNTRRWRVATFLIAALLILLLLRHHGPAGTGFPAAETPPLPTR